MPLLIKEYNKETWRTYITENKCFFPRGDIWAILLVCLFTPKFKIFLIVE
jgi:hypothetical protein